MSTDLEEKLANAQEELEALRSEYNDFTHAVSHDLAASFRQIEGFANIILAKHGDQFDEKSCRHFDLIIKGAENGAAMVESLLDYSRTCSVNMDISAVDCNTIVADVLSEYSELVHEKHADISCKKLPVVVGDATQLCKLFRHLIHNALLYHQPGSPPGIVMDSVEDEYGWQFRISDDGIGIPEKQIDRVFMVLKRAVPAKDYPGVGMGLAIAKRIVQLHNGVIGIEANEGAGCTVHFTLPKLTGPGTTP